jgi:hypothetical protein
MKTRMIVPAILSAVMLSTPVLAAGNSNPTPVSQPSPQKGASMTPAEKCASLEKQFDAAVVSHEKAARITEAQSMRSEGGNLCASGKYDAGIAKLDQALKDLGVNVKG